MALLKRDGKYWTPGGCSAWNGRAISGAAIDGVCNYNFLLFTRSGWYYNKSIVWRDFFNWLENNENPGCGFNSDLHGPNPPVWKHIDDAVFRTMKIVYWWDYQTMQWTFGEGYTFDELLEGCKIELP